jgi:predicted lipoprotein with Yx(FWY)xxD motif
MTAAGNPLWRWPPAAARGQETMMARFSLTRMPMPVRLALLLAAALVATACSSGGGGGSSSGNSSGTVITTRSGPLGTYLTSSSGRAVYVFMKDAMNKSACSGACAGIWPPVIAHGHLTGSGSAMSSDLGSITRSNGAKQVTYKGHPLYYFSGDSGAGMTKGQGISGFGAKWWLVKPSGQPLTAAAPGQTPSPPTSTGSGGGWA